MIFSLPPKNKYFNEVLFLDETTELVAFAKVCTFCAVRPAKQYSSLGGPGHFDGTAGNFHPLSLQRTHDGWESVPGWSSAGLDLYRFLKSLCRKKVAGLRKEDHKVLGIDKRSVTARKVGIGYELLHTRQMKTKRI